jgi:predicted nucleotidyltransferase
MNLINFLKSNTDARRVFGERELKIIEKQLLGINLTQSEKNRLSRDIRKKLAFIREAARFSDEFRLKKGSEIHKMIEDTKEIILSDQLGKSIKEILLFGSAAENTLTFRSDIDIAVKFDKIGLNEATLFRRRVAGRASDRIDIQVYNALPEKIKKEIELKAVKLYKNETF